MMQGGGGGWYAVPAHHWQPKVPYAYLTGHGLCSRVRELLPRAAN
jgi:hypothetical protein